MVSQPEVIMAKAEGRSDQLNRLIVATISRGPIKVFALTDAVGGPAIASELAKSLVNMMQYDSQRVANQPLGELADCFSSRRQQASRIAELTRLITRLIEGGQLSVRSSGNEHTITTHRA